MRGALLGRRPPRGNREVIGRPIVSQNSADPILSYNQNILRITADPTHYHANRGRRWPSDIQLA